MHTHAFADYVKCLDLVDWQDVAELMLSSEDKLGRIGADFLICPDNTLHHCRASSNAGLGLIGTRWLENDIYPEKLTAF